MCECQHKTNRVFETRETAGKQIIQPVNQQARAVAATAAAQTEENRHTHKEETTMHAKRLNAQHAASSNGNKRGNTAATKFTHKSTLLKRVVVVDSLLSRLSLKNVILPQHSKTGKNTHLRLTISTTQNRAELAKFYPSHLAYSVDLQYRMG